MISKKYELITLPKVSTDRGSLTFIESLKEVPFDIKRVYFVYDIPGGSTRDGHAHVELEQLIIPVSGSFDVVLDDGSQKETIKMNRANIGLRINKFVWRELCNFSSGSVCLILANIPYSEGDYIRDYSQFLKIINGYK